MQHETKIFKEKSQGGRLLDFLNPLERHIRTVAPIRIEELVGFDIKESMQMNIAHSMVYPVVIDRGNNTGDVEIAAVINHPLSESQILHLFNQFAPVSRDLSTKPLEAQYSSAVAADWNYMTAPSTKKHGYRQMLEGIHSARNVPGFAEFIPHAVDFLNALNNKDSALDFETSVTGRPILPLIHFIVRPDGTVEWDDRVISVNLNSALSNGIIPRMKQSEPHHLPQVDPVLDTFAGLVMPTYCEPERAAGWPKEIFGQKMSIAQAPVLNWQHKREHADSTLIKNLQEYIKSRV